MKLHPTSQRRRAFTLVEIMIVCAIVGILSSMALFAISRVKERTTQTLIANNLRQLYQAKEFYYSESGESDPIWSRELAAKGYLKQSTYDRIYASNGVDSQKGWTYSHLLFANSPAQAYRGRKPATGAPGSEDIINYPSSR